MLKTLLLTLGLVLAPALAAAELPAPAELLKQPGISGHYVTVVEPHQSDATHQTHVTYLAVAANQVAGTWLTKTIHTRCSPDGGW